MSIQTSTGVKIYISTQLPATFDLAGYGALTWTEIKEVTNIVPPSPSYQVVTHEPLKTGITQKNKGFVDYGDPTIDYALDTSDTGQQMLQSAASGATKNLEHSFKLTYPNGDIRYFSGRVFSSLEGGFSANSMVSGTSNVGVSRAIVKIPAISFAANYITNTYSILGESKTFADAHTFTRSTTATFVGSNGLIQSAAIDAPRFTYDPVTLAPKGLLIEGSRTNLLVRSENLDTTWVASGGSVSANNTTSPDGLLTADTFTESAILEGHSLSQSANFTNGTTYTLSCFAKRESSSRYCKMTMSSSAFGSLPEANFDVFNGSVVFSANCTATIEKSPSGFYRCAITATSAASVTAAIAIGMTNEVSGSFVYTGNGGSGLRIWGAQLEVGSFASSYIPTTTAQVTRTADVCTAKEFTSWYNQGEGSVFVDYNQYGDNNNSTGQYIIDFNDGTNSNRLNVRFAPDASQLLFRSTVFGVSSDNVTLTSGFLGGHKISSNLSSLALVDENSFDVTLTKSEYTQLSVGSSRDGTSQLNGTIAQLNYYPTALSDEALQDLTR